MKIKNKYFERSQEIFLFIKILKENLKLKKTIFLKLTNFDIFEPIQELADEFIEDHFYSEKVEIKDKYDLFIGSFPYGIRKQKTNTILKYENLNLRPNWIKIIESLKYIDNNGYGLFFVEPALFSMEWKRFVSVIDDQGYYINAIFNTKKNIHLPHTQLRSNLILISKNKQEKLFIAELLESENIQDIVLNFLNRKSTEYQELGMIVDPELFQGFDSFRINRQIEKLQQQYSSYKKLSFSEFAIKVNPGKPNISFKEIKNSIYIPTIGESDVVSELENTKLKHQNYYQVVVDNAKLLNSYAFMFFSSKLGKLILSSLYSGLFISKLNKSQLELLEIPVPTLEEQKRIIDTYKKLIQLSDTVSKLKEELSLNPKNAIEMEDNLNTVLSQLNILSEADQIRDYLRQGESKTIEFKQTLSLDIKKNLKANYIETNVIKTIGAFLNTEGGCLLIGISDDQEIVGINKEIELFYRNNSDKFLLHVKNIIKQRIGNKFFSFIDYKLVSIEGCLILKVDCKASNIECFVDDKDFYYRTNPATEKLEGSVLADYLKSRF